MRKAFSLTVADGVARLLLDLPDEPVNKISRGVREELDGLVDELRANRGVRAVVLLSGKPDTFIAGADIDEFTQLRSREEAHQLVSGGQALINKLERLSREKPIVAAIHGACLGGGLEAALACSYRIVTNHPKTTIGLPEVQLGIIPAAGGCQRLPRLIGLRSALDLILAGKTVPGKRAYRLGIADDLVHPAILESVALEAARRLMGGWRPRRKRRGLMAALLDGNPLGRALVFRAAERSVRAKTGGHYPAPLAALDSIRRGLRYGIDAGLVLEATLFAELAVGEVSRELVQIFFATNELKKDAGVANAPPAHPVASIGIVGAGFMGSAIGGTAVARAGVDVRLRDTDLTGVGKGLMAARGILTARLRRRRITKYEFRRQAALLSGGTSWAGFARADLVVEAVFEDLEVKRGVFRALEEVTREDCVLASNTSTIPIATIAADLRHPERVVGMHFFSPVDRMPLLEVIVADQSAPSAVVTAVAFGKRMGKQAVVVRDRPGFWVNRILAPYLNEAGRLVQEGVEIEAIDRAMRRFGFPVGPITLLDEVGLDVALKASQVLHAAFGDRLQPLDGLETLVGEKRLGRKTGRGFYRYERGKKRGVDPSVYATLGVGHAGAAAPPDLERRLVSVMLNEAARALDEGVVRSARDGDLAAIFGIGFPPFRGGPLRYLDRLGLAAAVEQLQELARSHGARFDPAPALEQMAKAGACYYPPT